MSCCVINCKNVRRLMPPDSKVSFHCFPRNKERLRQWLSVIGNNENTEWTRTLCVCSEHFSESDFIKNANSIFLKNTAVPNLKLPTPEYCCSPPLCPPIKTEEYLIESLILDTAPGLTDDDFMDPLCLSPIEVGDQEQRAYTDFIHFTAQQSSNKRCRSPSFNENLVPIEDQRVPTEFVCLESDLIMDSYRKMIKRDHTYALSSRKLKRRAEKLKVKCKKQILKKRINSLNKILKHLSSKSLISTGALEHLNLICRGVQSLFNQKNQTAGSQSLHKKRFPKERKQFAITLHFYSLKAYEYVTNTLDLLLPPPSIIRKWSSNNKYEPGFSKISFNTIALRVREADSVNRKVICSLLLDRMTLKKQIDFEGKRLWGYIDIGSYIENDELELAREALVIMVVCNSASWKIPIGYFLISSLTIAEKANIVTEALIRLHKVGVEIASVTCDGQSADFRLYQKLGCNFNVMDLKNYFQHPVDKEKKVFAMFDACDLVKLIGHSLAICKILVDPEGNFIKWVYIEKLYEFKKIEGFLLSNNLGKAYMQWQKHKVKVKLASQTLTNSVAEALLFLSDDLKHPDFQGCKATVKFIKTVGLVFDILNSKLPFAKGSKSPLKKENEASWRSVIALAMTYLLNIKGLNEKSLCETYSKTPLLAFVVTLESAVGIYNDFVSTGKLNCVFTHRCSQDHLEEFFCSVRTRSGYNTPTSLQFANSYQQVVSQADIRGNGECCPIMDLSTILTVPNGTKKLPCVEYLDVSCLRRSCKDYSTEAFKLHDYDVLPCPIDLSEDIENVTDYISRYMLKLLSEIIFCEKCLVLLFENVESSNCELMHRRNLGPFFPSKGVIKVCHETELFIRHVMYIMKNCLPPPVLVKDIMTSVTRKLCFSLETLFPNHPEHSFLLLKIIINRYSKFRFHNLGKRYSVSIEGELMVRQKINKILLFSYH